MPSIGSVVKPIKAEITKGGRATKFWISHGRWIQNVGWKDYGFSILVLKGEYHWKMGDRLKITKISSYSVQRDLKRRMFITVFVDAEYIPAGSVLDENMMRMLDDITEEYL